MSTAGLPQDAGYIVVPKKITLAVLWTLAGLIVSSTAGAMTVYTRLGNLEMQDSRHEQIMAERRSQVDARLLKLEQNQERLTRVEEQMSTVKEILTRIESRLYGITPSKR